MSETYCCKLLIGGPGKDLRDFKQANRGTPRDQWEQDAGRDVLDFEAMVPGGPHGCRRLALAKLESEGDDHLLYDYAVVNGNSLQWVQAVSRLWPNLSFVLLTETNESMYLGYGQRFEIRNGHVDLSEPGKDGPWEYEDAEADLLKHLPGPRDDDSAGAL